MSVNTNRWNRIRYTFYAPVYDVIAGVFKRVRRKSIAALNIQPGEKVLLVGAGTGLDLEFFPPHCEITATDLTPSMVERIRDRAEKLNLSVHAEVMDGQQLKYDNEQFACVVLHLILAVIPDPVACIRETDRVLRPGGRVAVLDKFVAEGKQISIWRRGLNKLTNLLFSDITRSIESIAASSSLKIVSNEGALFKGNFRLVQLVKPKSHSETF